MPEAIRTDTKTAVQTPKEKRTDVQKYLAEKFEVGLHAAPAEVAAALSGADRDRVTALEAEVAELPKKLQSWGKIQAVYDTGSAPATYRIAPRQSRHPRQRGIARLPQLVVRRESCASFLPMLRRWPDQRAPPGARPLADRARYAGRRANGPGDREPDVAAIVRRRNR